MKGDAKSMVRTWWNGFTRERQIAILLVFVCGSMAIIFSVLYVRSHLYDPYAVPYARLERARPIFEKQSKEERETQALQSTDTDQDGLSDFFELNQSHTSPYLADSDSDAMPDSIEMAQGTDPNCPKGRSCLSENRLLGVASATSSGSGTENADARSAAATRGMAEATNAFLLDPPAPERVSPADARRLLVESGLATAELLQSVDDLGVAQLYAATYQEIHRIKAAQAATAATSSSVPASP